MLHRCDTSEGRVGIQEVNAEAGSPLEQHPRLEVVVLEKEVEDGVAFVVVDRPAGQRVHSVTRFTIRLRHF